MIQSILFWDIDGTLLTTCRAGMVAWEGSFEEVAGYRKSFETYQTAGLTDVEIAAYLAREIGDDSSSTVSRLLHGYEDRLPECLSYRQGYVMPGVMSLLRRLQLMPEVYSMLLTGNTQRGAAVKLAHYGLTDFFKLGAFSDNLPDRLSVARLAVKLVQDQLPTRDNKQYFVIGDTPHDIRCGKAIGAKTIAVCTGGYKRQELMPHKPWLIFESFLDGDEFFEKTGLLELRGE